jgi:hypothetical protein
VIVAHAVHWLVALPAALVVAVLAIATVVEARRSRRRGVAVLRDEAADQPVSAAAEDEVSATRPPGPS